MAVFDVLFHRDYRGFSGGHLKVWDYFQHVAQSKEFFPHVYFSPSSVWDETNPWCGMRPQTQSRWAPDEADVLFLAGQDWNALPPAARRESAQPIINLIQGVRHADPAQPLAQFLGNRALRICVSPEVSDAILATGVVNGPVFTVCNGIDRQSLPAPSSARDIDILIAGVKNSAMAVKVGERFASLRVRCLTSAVPRGEFLAVLGRSQVAVLLPLEAEGFYLPALEAMALGSIVVCPDCVGNRSYCLDGVNCFRPPYALNDIVEAVLAARLLDEGAKAAMLARAEQTAQNHDLRNERSLFLGILENVFDLWRSNHQGPW